MPDLDIGTILVVLFFLSRFFFGGKKKKKRPVLQEQEPVFQENPQLESEEASESQDVPQTARKRKPNFIEQMVQQLEDAAKEADRKRREANGEFIPQDPEPRVLLEEVQEPVRTKSGPNRDSSLNRKSEKLRSQNKAAKQTQLEQVFGKGFSKDQSFEDKPTYSEGRHFDTGHKEGHEDDPVFDLPNAYKIIEKESGSVNMKETLVGLDLKKAMIINEVLGPPAAKRPRQPHER